MTNDQREEQDRRIEEVAARCRQTVFRDDEGFRSAAAVEINLALDRLNEAFTRAGAKVKIDRPTNVRVETVNWKLSSEANAGRRSGLSIFITNEGDDRGCGVTVADHITQPETKVEVLKRTGDRAQLATLGDDLLTVLMDRLDVWTEYAPPVQTEIREDFDRGEPSEGFAYGAPDYSTEFPN